MPAAERELAAHAASRRRIGEHGAVELAKELEGLGFGSLHEMKRVMLPREVAALVSVGVRVPAATSAALEPVARILDSAAMIEKETDALVYELASLASQGFPEVRSLAQLAAECRGLSLVYDDAATERRLAAARDALAELS
ncbi:hypothetical protein SAMN05216355_10378 [Actinomyces ruminicola]|uniref:Uncharacterized protein n=1 Tax=Actinomyces ruminicola TaxID=332524 RepID=A0A1H0B4R9_9ACTO|nr:hypothetical protein [Actinomyces ruminicola]SDN40614.1 hypothetical protein SAMN05216355_10378 [Actinomyces ruminicola]